MSDITGLTARVAALEQELRDVQQLTDATEGLSQAATGLNSRLTTLGQAMETARSAQRSAAQANVKADDSIVALARSEHRYRRHTRRMAGLAIVVSLLATGGVLLLQRHTAEQFNDFRGMIAQRCEQRQHQYDEPNHLSVGADVTELESQLRQARASQAATRTLIHTFPPAQRPALWAQVLQARKDLRNDLAVKKAAFAAGVIGSCQNLK